MEALRFEHQDGDYQVIVRSEDLSYAWERFKGRIDYDNDSKPNYAIRRALLQIFIKRYM